MAARFLERESGRAAEYEVDPDAVKRLATAQLRKIHGESYEPGAEEIATLLGSVYSTYWRTMTGRTSLAAATALQWADRLDCQVHDLYRRPRK